MGRVSKRSQDSRLQGAVDLTGQAQNRDRARHLERGGADRGDHQGEGHLQQLGPIGTRNDPAKKAAR